jgi:hypothetical protein
MSIRGSSAELCQQEWEYERLLRGGIVVAVDGSRESIAALNTGAAIACRRRVPLHAVTVIPPIAAHRISPGTGARQDNLNELRISLKASELNVLMKAVGAEEHSWTHSAMIGDDDRRQTLTGSSRSVPEWRYDTSRDAAKFHARSCCRC